MSLGWRLKSSNHVSQMLCRVSRLTASRKPLVLFLKVLDDIRSNTFFGIKEDFFALYKTLSTKGFLAKTKRLYLSSILACTKPDYKPIILVNVLSKGKNREQNSSHTMNTGSTLLRTYCLFLFTFEKTKKSDFGPDEFKVIREIILAHPRLQKKER